MTSPPATLVVGLGNDLAGDDAVGPTVIRRLAEAGAPAHWRLATAGADALAVACLWRGEPRVWLVDAVRADTPPGTLHSIDHDTLLGPRRRPRDAHHLSVAELLGWMVVARSDMHRIRFHLWGVEAASFRPGRPLDDRVLEGVGRLVARLRCEGAGAAPSRD